MSIFDGETHIGTAVLEHLDPPMGVAFGPFAPTSHYDRDKHANTVDGEYVGDLGQSLSARGDEASNFEVNSVVVEDYTGSQLGTHLTLYFADGLTFASLFGTHPDYLAYYPQRDEGR